MTAVQRAQVERSQALNVRFLVGTSAHNQHAQQIVRSLHEAGALHSYETAGVDRFEGPVSQRLRQALASAAPAISRELARRSVPDVPPGVVRSHWGWELPRIAASRVPGGERLEDWLWEREEWALDHRCALRLRDPQVGGFLGVEHGALESLRAARSLGKPGIVAFFSPHHSMRERWVEADFKRFPELMTAGRTEVERLAAIRNARRDEEARTADWIETGSSFVTQSLIEAGFPATKILTVPLGGATPIPQQQLPARAPSATRIVYVGAVSIHKGVHYLLRAWRAIAGRGAELHLYGRNLLPESAINDLLGPARESVVFHGPVPRVQLTDVYVNSSLLVLPTLCDGFGLAISEALAHGLPVLTTTNAGAADLVEPGKTGFIVPPADANALADKLQWAIDHPDALFAMRPRALANAGRWTWSDFRRRQVTLLSEALAGHRA